MFCHVILQDIQDILMLCETSAEAKATGSLVFGTGVSRLPEKQVGGNDVDMIWYDIGFMIYDMWYKICICDIWYVKYDVWCMVCD